MRRLLLRKRDVPVDEEAHTISEHDVAASTARTSSHRCRSQPLNPDDAGVQLVCAVMLRVCEAMRFTAEQADGLLHRDMCTVLVWLQKLRWARRTPPTPASSC